METATNTNSKARTEKTAAPTDAAFSTQKFEMPKFEMPKMEVPEAYRQFAEKHAAQTKEAFGKIKTASEEATGIFEQTYATAAKGVASYNLEVVKAARTNTNAALEFAQKLLGVKSPSEFFELSTKHAREQFEVVSAQAKELATLGQTVITDVAAPVRAGMEKASQKAA